MAELNYGLLTPKQPEPYNGKSALEVFENMQKFHEGKRKYAIEKARASALKADGSIDPTLARQSLIAQGFGGDADDVVRGMMNPRREDVGKMVELGVQLKALVDAGMIDQDAAMRALSTGRIAQEAPKETVDMSWAEGVPQSSVQTQTTRTEQPKIQESVTPKQSEAVDGEVRLYGTTEKPQAAVGTLPEIPSQTYQKTPAQVVPEYASDFINWEAKTKVGAEDVGKIDTSSFKYKLPTDTRDLSETITAAQRIGYDVSNPTDESLDAQITERATAIAGPPPVMTPAYNLADITKNNAEYIQKYREWVSKISEAKQAQVDAISKERSGKFGEVQSKEAQDFALAGQKDAKGNPLDIFSRRVSPAEAAVVKTQRAAVDDIATADMSTFEGQYKAALAKAKADGSVNQDAIMANLVAMGAVPSSSALYLKQFMTPGGSLSSEFITFGKQVIAKLSEKEKAEASAKSASWKNNAISNINQYIKDNGGISYVGSSSSRITAGDVLGNMGVGKTKQPEKPIKPTKPAKRTSEGM